MGRGRFTVTVDWSLPVCAMIPPAGRAMARGERGEEGGAPMNITTTHLAHSQLLPVTRSDTGLATTTLRGRMGDTARRGPGTASTTDGDNPPRRPERVPDRRFGSMWLPHDAPGLFLLFIEHGASARPIIREQPHPVTITPGHPRTYPPATLPLMGPHVPALTPPPYLRAYTL